MRILRAICCKHSHFRFVKETAGTQTPVTFDDWFRQNILGDKFGPYWPVHPSSTVMGWRNILAGVETSPGQSPGCYIQAIGPISIGDYTQIAPNVGIISANHEFSDNRKHIVDAVVIGKYCWIGMGAIILPGVVLGDFTVVGAGAIVTKSFPDGYCVIGGNPARSIKSLSIEDCVCHRSEHEYHGYIRKSDFDAFREKNLNV
jgi:carbonic anhydrase/acetyltransferase-like protein (isoleucine patch superfamily)